MNRARLTSLSISLVLAYGAAALGSAFTAGAINTWYATLVKPALNPPNALFGPVWSVLYALMAVAAWRVYEKREGGATVHPILIVYAVHLGINALWSIVFFGIHAPSAALGMILLLDIVVAYLTFRFYRIDRPAGLLLIPYLAWILFATYLNTMIALVNE